MNKSVFDSKRKLEREKAWPTQTLDILLGILVTPDLGAETHQVSKATTRFCISEAHRILYQHSERRGVPITVVDGQELQQQLNYAKELSNDSMKANPSFPLSLNAKLRVMTGISTFGNNVTIKFGDLTSGLMIVGAHIRYPSTTTGQKNPGTKLDRYHPAITAVVASTNESSVFFPGTVRFQRRIDTFDTGTQKYQPELRLMYLRTMMEAGFRAWDDRSKTPTKLLFHRSGINFDNRILKEECSEIRDAFSTVYPSSAKDLQLTYVVVNKNAMLTHGSPHTPTPENIDDPIKPKYIVRLSEDGFNKHEYYVIEDGIGMGDENLRELVCKHFSLNFSLH